jgi:hypothetical protein
MMKKTGRSRPLAAWLLIILLILIGIGAVISGVLLFIAPDGHLLQLPLKYLEGSPFSDFLTPGIILFVFVGIYPLMVGYSLVRKPSWRWPDVLNPSKTMHWSWAAALAAGTVMLGWIAVETLLLGYISFLQPVILGYGLLVIILTLLPAVRGYYKR